MNLDIEDRLEERNSDTRLASGLYIVTGIVFWYWLWWIGLHTTKTLLDLSWYQLEIYFTDLPTILFWGSCAFCLAFFTVGLLVSFAPEKVRHSIFPLSLCLWPPIYMIVRNCEWPTNDTKYWFLLVFGLLILSTVHSFLFWWKSLSHKAPEPWISSENLNHTWPISLMAICIYIFFLGTALN